MHKLTASYQSITVTYGHTGAKCLSFFAYNTRHKSWNTCVIFPFPNVDLGITVILLLQNMRGSTMGKERRKFKWEQRCQEWM